MPAMMLPLNSQNYKCATIASPTPRNTPATERPSHLNLFGGNLPPSRSSEYLYQNLPTPGMTENPLSWHMRLEKSSSLQANRKTKNVTQDDPTYPAPDDLERFLYGNAAFNLEDAVF